MFDGVVGEAVGGRVVYLDWSGRLLVPYFASIGQPTDVWDSSQIGLEPNSFTVGQQTDI